MTRCSDVNAEYAAVPEPPVKDITDEEQGVSRAEVEGIDPATNVNVASETPSPRASLRLRHLLRLRQ